MITDNSPSHPFQPTSFCNLLTFARFWVAGFYILPPGFSRESKTSPGSRRVTVVRFALKQAGGKVIVSIWAPVPKFVLILRRRAPQVKLFATD